MNSALIPPVRGMHDILPPQTAAWQRLENAVGRCFHRYGYGEIRTPIVERLDLFRRQLGEYSDIVQKEMYSFVDALNNDMLVLRPEATVSTLRALLNGGMHRSGVTRVWYSGPMFRHEKPQKGRYRQFHQYGAEAVGSQDPAMDAEQIIMLARLWRELNIADKLELDINNLGIENERHLYKQRLQAYFANYESEMDDADKYRLQNNPLRLLDSKNPAVAVTADDAPHLHDSLSKESRRFVDAVKNKISAAGVPFKERPALVRGLDYYNLTVFEWTIENDENRQNTVCGGGRYDGLAEKIGGDMLPGCGFAFGVERVLALLAPTAPTAPDCYLAITDESCADYADDIAETCRNNDLSVWRHVGGNNLARQLKKADAMQTPLAIIIGTNENQGGYVTLKRLADGQQEKSPLAAMTTTIKKMLGHDR